MAKSKAKHAKNKAAKLNSVETEKAKAVKKGEEEIIEDEELEEVEEIEEVEEDVEDDESEEDDEELEDESEDEDDEDEDEDEDSEDDDSDDEDDEEDDDESEEDDEDEDDESEDESDDDDSDEDEDDDDEDDEEEDEEEELPKKSQKSQKEAKVRTKADKTVVRTITSTKSTQPSKLKIFFSRKGDENENILTIFKDTRIIGAIIGEIIGTAIVTMIVLTLGLFNPLYMILAYVGLTLAIVKLSGAHLNPIVTAGMMASRRISAIRGVIYLISQVLGAWLGLWVINGFYKSGIASGNIDAATSVLPSLTAITSLAGANEDFSFFWPTVMVEFLGAIIIAFFFARAIRVKKQSETSFAITVATGMFIAMLLAVVINSNFFYMQDNTFIMNPAIGMIYGIFPTSADGFDSLMNALLPMFVAYVVFPVLGGILGFFLSDFANLAENEDLKDNA